MRQTEIDILNLENKLQQDRRELNDLIYRYREQGAGQDIMNSKLQNMQQEINYMGNQLDMLRKMLQKDSEGILLQQQPMPPQQQPLPPQQQPLPPMPPQQQPLPPQQPSMPLQQQPLPLQQHAPADKKDLEKTFGKSWMGVIASGLVFVSFIFFAVMLLPVLTDGMKIAAMFIVSFIFTGVGFAKLRTDRENKFYLALSGCGVGAVYISILVSNIYFKAVGDIALYLLIFVWAVCVCYLRRMGGILFQLIGQLGITVAILFGCMVCVEHSDEVKVLMLALFFAITSMIFMAAHRQKQLSKNAISLIFNMVNLFLLLVTLGQMHDSVMIKVVSVILIVYIALHFAFCYLCEALKDGMDFGIATVVCMMLAVGFFNILLRNVPSEDIMVNAAILIISIISLVAAEIRLGADARAGGAVIQIMAMLLIYYAVCNTEFLNKHVYLAVPMLLFLCAGFSMRNWFFKYGSVIYMFLFLLHIQMDNPEKMLWGFAYFGALTYFMLREKEHYQSFFKLLAYGIFLIKITADCAYVTDILGADTRTAITVCCIVVGGINMVMLRIGQMGINPITKKPETETIIILNIVHVIQMSVMLSQLLLPHTGYMNFINISWAIALFMINTKKLLVGKKDSLAGIYVGIKFTVLLLAILCTCDISGVIASICCFGLAVACIVTGFHLECKPLRIYGLVLSMIIVFKMSLIDIAFGGLLHLAAGFFVSGILCFAISRIYNSIDEKMNKQL